MVIWAALLGSQVIYALMASMGLGKKGPPPSDELMTILAVVAVSNALIAMIAPRMILSQRLKQGPLHTESDRLAALFPALIIRYALYEAVALFGLVIALTGGEISQSGPFFGAGMVLMLLNAPTAGYRRRMLMSAGDTSAARGG